MAAPYTGTAILLRSLISFESSQSSVASRSSPVVNSQLSAANCQLPTASNQPSCAATRISMIFLPAAATEVPGPKMATTPAS